MMNDAFVIEQVAEQMPDNAAAGPICVDVPAQLGEGAGDVQPAPAGVVHGRLAAQLTFGNHLRDLTVLVHRRIECEGDDTWHGLVL